ncbi:MAG: hypothetical protein R3A10_07005 [Caldilineaceae bacterium]
MDTAERRLEQMENRERKLNQRSSKLDQREQQLSQMEEERAAELQRVARIPLTRKRGNCSWPMCARPRGTRWPRAVREIENETMEEAEPPGARGLWPWPSGALLGDHVSEYAV